MTGPIYEVMSKLIKAVTGSKITVPGSFRRWVIAKQSTTIPFNEKAFFTTVCIKILRSVYDYHIIK